jgi:hypothetical protein
MREQDQVAPAEQAGFPKGAARFDTASMAIIDFAAQQAAGCDAQAAEALASREFKAREYAPGAAAVDPARGYAGRMSPVNDACIIAAAIALLAAAPATATDDFERFVASWAGDYDNLHQPAPYVPTRLHIRRIELPAFGPRAFYAEWIGANDGRVLRQRIYAFSIDADGRWRLALHIWPADRADFVARTAGAWRDPARLSGVTPADMAGLAGCDVLFEPHEAPLAGVAEPHGTAWSGEMRRGDCVIPSPGVEQRVYSWSRMRRSQDRFEYRDGWYFAADDAPYREFSPGWYEFRRSPAKADSGFAQLPY